MWIVTTYPLGKMLFSWFKLNKAQISLILTNKAQISLYLVNGECISMEIGTPETELIKENIILSKQMQHWIQMQTYGMLFVCLTFLIVLVVAGKIFGLIWIYYLRSLAQ